MFDCAIFDLDGTLVDSERVIMRAWVDAARELGIALEPEAYSAVIGLNQRQSVEVLVALLGGAGAYASVRARVAARLCAGASEATFPAKAGADALLRALGAKSIPCAVASSSSAAEIRHRLAGAGVLAHFRAIAGGDEVPRGKPDPAVYKLAVQRLGASERTCVAFEDSEHGAAAALAAGLAVVLVPDLRALPNTIAKQSLCVIGTLAEAIEHLPAWFPAARGA
ncbi:MAG TPA: HAD family phosphatase [Burkholderiaceae bacterium]